VPSGSQRAEIEPDVPEFSEGQTRWFRLSYVLPTSFPTDPQGFQLATQWKNDGTAVHNVVFDNQQLPSSDPMNQNDTFEVKFTKPGTYSYVCKFHEANNMRGTVTVTGG